MYFQRKILFVFFLCVSTVISARNTLNYDDCPPRDSNTFLAAYPLAFYFPETRLGFGGAGIYTFLVDNDSTNLASNIQVGLGYTLNRQLLLYSSANIWYRQGTRVLNGELGYYDYFYPTYGLGTTTLLSDETNYFVRYPRLKVRNLFKLKKSLFLGPSLHLEKYQMSDIDQSGWLAQDQPIGYDGSTLVGIGLSGWFDTRDVQFYPGKGIFADAIVMHYDPGLGSSSRFTKGFITFSHYSTLASKIILVSNLFAESVYGDPPFQELAQYGGPKYGRGFVIGRFVDRHRAGLQSEVRFPIVWRLKGTVFGSYGNVFDSLSSITQQMKWNAGLGLRVLISKSDQLHIRIDYGRSNEGGELYITLGEAF